MENNQNEQYRYGGETQRKCIEWKKTDNNDDEELCKSLRNLD